MPTAGMQGEDHAATTATLPVVRVSLGDLRRQRNVTQAELARRLNVSQASVSKMEKGRPTVATVRRYLIALGGELEVHGIFADDAVALDL